MPLPEIATGLASVKTLGSLIKGIKGISDSVKQNEIIIEAQEVMLAMQDSLSVAQERINTLTQENSDLVSKLKEEQAWRKRLADYRLIEMREGLFIYEFIENSEAGGTPSHWACPKCIASKKIEILQKPQVAVSKLKCFSCDFSVDSSKKASRPVMARIPRPRSNRSLDGF